MKIDGHRQRQSRLHYSRDEDDFSGSKKHAQASNEHKLCDPARQKQPQARENHAEIEAELRLAGSEMQVKSGGIELVQGPAVDLNTAFQNGSGNSGDREHGEKSHLEPGIKQRFGVSHK